MTDLEIPSVDAAPSGLGGHFYQPPLPMSYVSRSGLCELLSGLSGACCCQRTCRVGKSSLAIEFCEYLSEPWRSLWLGLSPTVTPDVFSNVNGGLQQYFQVGSGSELCCGCASAINSLPLKGGV
jgi:LuxR family maltose regulon positive regulatory protein